MSPAQITVLCSIALFFGGLVMAVIGYFLKQLVDQLKELNKTVTELKTTVILQSEKHDNLEKRVEKLEDSI